jgi:CRP-like cAMP-binding protein
METVLLRQWLVNVGGRPSDVRMAHFLLEWMVRKRAAGLAAGESCAFPMSQEDLAKTLAMSGVHVNRTLQTLRKSGLVTVHDRVLTVLDMEKLRRFSDFDDRYLEPRRPR